MSSKPNYRTICFDARLRGYNSADWATDIQGGIALFTQRGEFLGLHYRHDGRWYSEGDWAMIPDDYSLTPDEQIAYVLDMRQVVRSARIKIQDEERSDE